MTMVFKVVALLIALGVAGVTLAVCFDSRILDQGKVRRTALTPDSAADTLVVLLHAFSSKPGSLDDVRTALADHLGGRTVDFLQPDLPLGSMSVVTTDRIVAELVQAVDAAWDKKADGGTPYRRVILVGHSFGALLARKLYVVGMGETADAPFEKGLIEETRRLGLTALSAPRPWASAVDRIVLMAGMNRGWSISHHMSLTRAALMQAGVATGWVIERVSGRLPVVLRIRRGAPFITQLRLQWMAMESGRRSAESGSTGPTVVQLLGTVDDLVAPDDNIDLVTGSEFIYLEVPASGHRNVVTMDTTAQGRGRRAAFLRALDAQVSDEQLAMDVYGGLQTDDSVTDVVFVIHGIRDQGFWTKKIALRVKELARQRPAENRVVHTETSSYGYFPMLSFLIPGARAEKVAWLMDRYTEAKARFRGARFHYVGHSNGTYLLARAMQDYESVRFDHVAFAGSVVRTSYPWDALIRGERKRLGSAYNFVATSDWVVALFPKAFELIGWQDLGSAGHDGFTQAASLGELHEAGYVVGGHGAALDEAMWDTIAGFILTGEAGQPPQELLRKAPARWLNYLSRVAWLVPLIIALGLAAGLVLILRSDLREGFKTAAIIFYLYACWLVLTRV